MENILGRFLGKNFFREECWGNISVFCAEQAEMLPIFLEQFLGFSDFAIWPIKKRCAHFLSFLGLFDFGLILFEEEGSAAHLS